MLCFDYICYDHSHKQIRDIEESIRLLYISMAETNLHINSFIQNRLRVPVWHLRGLGGHKNAKIIVQTVMHASLADARLSPQLQCACVI